MRCLLLLLLVSSVGCVGHIGVVDRTVVREPGSPQAMRVEHDTGRAEALRDAKCSGISWNLWAEGPCGHSGGKLSIPGLALVRHVVDGALSWVGKPPPQPISITIDGEKVTNDGGATE